MMPDEESSGAAAEAEATTENETPKAAQAKRAKPKLGYGGVPVGEQVPLHQANRAFQEQRADRGRHTRYTAPVRQKPLRGPL